MPLNPTVDFSVEILDGITGYTATISKQERKARPAEFVRWFIDKTPSGFPKRATIFIQFNEPGKTPVDGPLVDGDVTKGRFNATGRVIGGTIKLSGTSCKYSLYYEEKGEGPKLLTDPELVIDGNRLPPILTKFLNGRQKLMKAFLKEARSKASRKPATAMKKPKASNKPRAKTR